VRSLLPFQLSVSRDGTLGCSWLSNPTQGAVEEVIYRETDDAFSGFIPILHTAGPTIDRYWL